MEREGKRLKEDGNNKRGPLSRFRLCNHFASFSTLKTRLFTSFGVVVIFATWHVVVQDTAVCRLRCTG